jgi:hypothetical protein
LRTDPILRASDPDHFSDSEPEELPALSGDAAFSTILSDVLRRLLAPISLRGDVLSESELKVCIVGGAGEPSDFLDNAPRAKRPARLRSTDALGGDGIGEEPF